EPKESTINNCIGMYALVMLPVTSYLGDCNLYDKSDEKNNIIFVNSLYNRRLVAISASLYDMLWVDSQRKNKKIAMHRGIAYEYELKRCMLLSSLIKKNGNFRFFCKKLNNGVK
ncbi:MAG: hypothetical protein ACI4R6_00115, partial [Lachnospiraceae bacterium]